MSCLWKMNHSAFQQSCRLSGDPLQGYCFEHLQKTHFLRLSTTYKGNEKGDENTDENSTWLTASFCHPGKCEANYIAQTKQYEIGLNRFFLAKNLPSKPIPPKSPKAGFIHGLTSICTAFARRFYTLEFEMHQSTEGPISSRHITENNLSHFLHSHWKLHLLS